jgi:ubiquinone/menaquinone biosynthesis C-methylase UbiE
MKSKGKIKKHKETKNHQTWMEHGIVCAQHTHFLDISCGTGMVHALIP